MKEILTGKKAQALCQHLLTPKRGEGVQFQFNTKEPQYARRGYWQNELNTWTAFDNRTHNCWVEDFETEAQCLGWLNDKGQADDIRPAHTTELKAEEQNIFDSEGKPIGMAFVNTRQRYIGKKEAEANARLWAVAPELLEYLKQQEAAYDNLFAQRKPTEAEQADYDRINYLLHKAEKL